MDVKEYKKYHENYMKNNHGTSYQECLILMLTIPFCTFLSSFVSSSKSKLAGYILEFGIVIVPSFLNVTIFSNINQIIFLNFICFFAIIFLTRVDINTLKEIIKFRSWDSRPCITNYRASINFFSVLCILSVDFTIFPQRLAKTESFGFGLMDFGVGFFVFSNGIVSKHVITKNHLPKILKNVTVLFLLGLIRVVSIKSIDYPEHVSEYGVHWNFFFSLGLCHLVSYLLMISTNNMNPKWLALLTATVHQFLLSYRLQEWVLSDIPRNSLLSANREGLTSCLGYVSIYFAASAIRKSVLKSDGQTYKKLLIHLTLLTGLIWTGAIIAYKIFKVSRRLINIGYIFCTVGFSLFGFLLFIVGELVLLSVSKKKSTVNLVPNIFACINSNGLFFFMFGNLLTGIINTVFQTLLLGKLASLVIILSYMIVLCSVTCFLYEKKIFIKL